MKKAIVFALALALLTAMSPLFASAQAGLSKDETVYVNLDAGGGVRRAYVVNAFDAPTAQHVTDYGTYTAVESLSDLTPLAAAGGRIELELPAGRFYYKGSLETQDFPWNFALEYRLDGVAVTPEEMAGQSGAFELVLDVTPGAEKYAQYYENYVLQISYTLDADRFSAVEAEGGSIASVGRYINVTHTLMQGGEGHYTLRADVRDFAFPGLSAQGVLIAGIGLDRAVIDQMMGEFTGELEEIDRLTAAGGELRAGVAAFGGGLASLETGLKALAAGSQQFRAGLDGLAAALAQPPDEEQLGALALAQQMLQSPDPQVSALAAAFLAQSAALSELGQHVAGLAAAYADIDDGLRATADAAGELPRGYGAIQSGVADYVDGVQQAVGQIEQLPAQMEQGIDELIGGYTGSGREVSSFASDKNDTRSVTFVYKTEGISAPDTASADDAPRVPETFWERLLDLFGLFRP